MSKIATIVASILFAFSAIAAGTSEQAVSKKPVVTSTVNQPAAEHDYQLERDSCCGPQHE